MNEKDVPAGAPRQQKIHPRAEGARESRSSPRSGADGPMLAVSGLTISHSGREADREHACRSPISPTPGRAIVQGLCVARGGRAILRQMSLRFERGALTALVGPSGAGKTTLINVLNGLIAPTCCQISTPETGVVAGPAHWRAMRESTATIFQDHALIGRLSALDNVLLGFADRRHPLSLMPWSLERRRRAARPARRRHAGSRDGAGRDIFRRRKAEDRHGARSGAAPAIAARR